MSDQYQNPRSNNWTKPGYKQNMNRRARKNDYRGSRIYMISITKNKSVPAFGVLKGDPKIPNNLPGAPYVELSDLGKCIYRRLYRIDEIDKSLQIFRFIVMPDHIHFILNVTEELRQHVGSLIGILKGKITKDLWELFPAFKNSKISAFEPNYNDRILLHRNQLEMMKNYVADNPRRLAIRRVHPEFFRRCLSLYFRDGEYDFFGNPFLMRQYSKIAIKVRSRWTDAEFEERRARWRKLMTNGAIPVSPFISRREKIIRDDAIRMGVSLIIVGNESFPERFKPSGEYFRLCSEGKLLLIAPKGMPVYNPNMTRVTAEWLNQVADMIANLTTEESVIHMDGR